MRLVFTIIAFLTCTFITRAQDSITSLDPTEVIESLIADHYCDQGVEIDSCSHYPLYTEIYNWLDVPYRYAGNSKNGIDCSGLTKRIYYKVYNIKLLGSARSIARQTYLIDQEELTEGDLVFFKIKKSYISHIGIYLRDGYFVHASFSNGVIISHLDENYYKKYFYSGGRFPNE